MADNIKAAIGIALLLVALALGWFVNGYRLNTAHEIAMHAKQAEVDTLTNTVREQNHAVDALGAAKVAADERRVLAEKYAGAVVARIGSRADAVSNSKAPDCDGVMREAWSGWK